MKIIYIPLLVLISIATNFVFAQNENQAKKKSNAHAYITSLSKPFSICEKNPENLLVNCRTTESGLNEINIITLHPNHRFAYVASLYLNKINYCSLKENGDLQSCKTTGSDFSSIQSISINHAGSYAYIVNDVPREQRTYLSICKIKNDGSFFDCKKSEAIKSIQGFAINSFDNIAYVAEQDTLSYCHIDINGDLINCRNSQHGDFGVQTKITIDPKNKFLYVNSRISSINPDGSLDYLHDLNSSTDAITITADGKYAYLKNLSSSSILRCSIKSDGMFDTCKTVMIESQPQKILIEPNNKNAYIARPYQQMGILHYSIKSNGSFDTTNYIEFNSPSDHYAAMKFDSSDSSTVYLRDRNFKESTISFSTCALKNDHLEQCKKLDTAFSSDSAGNGLLTLIGQHAYIQTSPHHTEQITHCFISKDGSFNNCSEISVKKQQTNIIKSNSDSRLYLVDQPTYNNESYTISNCLIKSNGYLDCQPIWSEKDPFPHDFFYDFAIDLKEEFAYIVHHDIVKKASKIIYCRINHDGKLENCNDMKDDAFEKPKSLVISPIGNIVYISHGGGYGDDSLSYCKIDSLGRFDECRDTNNPLSWITGITLLE